MTRMTRMSLSTRVPVGNEGAAARHDRSESAIVPGISESATIQVAGGRSGSAVDADSGILSITRTRVFSQIRVAPRLAARDGTQAARVLRVGSVRVTLVRVIRVDPVRRGMHGRCACARR